MAALKRLKKSKRGKAVCEVCDEQIKVGDYYEKFSVRFSNPRTRCDKHPFRQSDMAQGKNATAYGVQEYLEDWKNGIVEKDEKPFDFEVLKVRVDGAMSDIENLAEEYEDGANNISEHFGNTFQTDKMEEDAQSCRAMLDSLNTLQDKLNDKEEKLSLEDVKSEIQEVNEQITF